MRYYYLNGNPWLQCRPDCSVRSISVALNMSYVKVCEMLGVECRRGYGLVTNDGAATFEEIINAFANGSKKYLLGYEVDEMYDAVVFGKKTRKAKKVDHGYEFDLDNGFTVEEYADMIPKGLYLFVVRPNKQERMLGEKDWHMTIVDTKLNVLIDGGDYRKSLVYGYVQVNEKEILDPKDEDSRFMELVNLDYPKNWDSPNAVPKWFEDALTLKEWKAMVKNNTPIKHAYEIMLREYGQTDYFYQKYKKETGINAESIMKKYIIKNYKGNLLESIIRFQNKYNSLKIVEAVENDGKLKISAKSIDEDMGGQFNQSRSIYKKGRSANEKPRYYLTIDTTPKGNTLYVVKLADNSDGFEIVKASQQDEQQHSINVHPYTTVKKNNIHGLALLVLDKMSANKLKALDISGAYITIRKETAHMMTQSRKGDIAWSTGMPVAYYDGYNWNTNLTKLLGSPSGFEIIRSIEQVKKRLISFFKSCLNTIKINKAHAKRDELPEIERKNEELKKAYDVLLNNGNSNDERLEFPYWALREFNAKQSLWDDIHKNMYELNDLFDMAIE